MELDYLFARGQTDPCSDWTCGILNSLKNEKDSFEVRRLNAHTIVAYPELMLRLCAVDTYMDLQRYISPKLYSIAYKILKKSSYMNRNSHYRRHMVSCYPCSALIDGRSQIRKSVRETRIAISRLKLLLIG